MSLGQKVAVSLGHYCQTEFHMQETSNPPVVCLCGNLTISNSKILFIFNYVFMCVCVCNADTGVFEHQKKTQNPWMELELQVKGHPVC